VINSTATVSYVDGSEAVLILCTAVQVAQQELLGSPRDLANVNEVLAAVFVDVAPIYGLLRDMATAQPAGPVAAMLAHLRVAFGHAASGRAELAVTGMVNASVTAFRLADGSDNRSRARST
jgi:hypothetical protein